MCVRARTALLCREGLRLVSQSLDASCLFMSVHLCNLAALQL
jgi:hypothetical protein